MSIPEEIIEPPIGYPELSSYGPIIFDSYWGKQLLGDLK